MPRRRQTLKHNAYLSVSCSELPSDSDMDLKKPSMASTQNSVTSAERTPLAGDSAAAPA